MEKVIISASISLKEEIIKRKSRRESQGKQVINYPQSIDPFTPASYAEVHAQFCRDLIEADTFFLMNEDNKGIEGYIWMSMFAELHFVLLQNTLYGKNKKILLLKSPSPQVACYEEIMLRKQLGRIEIWLPTT